MATCAFEQSDLPPFELEFLRQLAWFGAAEASIAQVSARVCDEWMFGAAEGLRKKNLVAWVRHNHKGNPLYRVTGAGWELLNRNAKVIPVPDPLRRSA